MAAKTSTQLYPPQKAIIRAEIELTTEEKAFVAQAQGIIPFSALDKNRIPEGNGNPITKPRGKIKQKEKNSFGKSAHPIMLLNNTGSIHVYPRIRQPADIKGKMIFFVGWSPRSFFDKRLPIPDEKSKAKIVRAVE